jgi:hypothetical protein
MLRLNRIALLLFLADIGVCPGTAAITFADGLQERLACLPSALPALETLCPFGHAADRAIIALFGPTARCRRRTWTAAPRRVHPGGVPRSSRRTALRATAA